LDSSEYSGLDNVGFADFPPDSIRPDRLGKDASPDYGRLAWSALPLDTLVGSVESTDEYTDQVEIDK
jgi:hypothetical protein